MSAWVGNGQRVRRDTIGTACQKLGQRWGCLDSRMLAHGNVFFFFSLSFACGQQFNPREDEGRLKGEEGSGWKEVLCIWQSRVGVRQRWESFDWCASGSD